MFKIIIKEILVKNMEMAVLFKTMNNGILFKITDEGILVQLMLKEVLIKMKKFFKKMVLVIEINTKIVFKINQKGHFQNEN